MKKDAILFAFVVSWGFFVLVDSFLEFIRGVLFPCRGNFKPSRLCKALQSSRVFFQRKPPRAGNF